jgi:hypothetical protein
LIFISFCGFSVSRKLFIDFLCIKKKKSAVVVHNFKSQRKPFLRPRSSHQKPANLPVMFRRVVKISFFDHYFASFSY